MCNKKTLKSFQISYGFPIFFFYIFLVVSFIALLPSRGSSFQVPDTGLIKCYDDFGEIQCPNSGEDFDGQDATYDINPPSYTKIDAEGKELPNDATKWAMVQDNVTGLIWEIKTNDETIHDKDRKYSWYNASNMFDELNAAEFGGFSDWRMPTVKELSTITDKTTHWPAVNSNYFPNIVRWDTCWSSTTAAEAKWGQYAFIVPFNHGQTTVHHKSEARLVLAVRGKQSQPEQINNSDGTVTDVSTGLMWQQETVGPMTWKERR